MNIIKKPFWIFALSMILVHPVVGQNQETYILDAHIVDKVTGQPIPLAHIQIADFNAATISAENGWFRIIAPSGEYNFYFSHLAYELTHEIITLKSDTSCLIFMDKKHIAMEEVVVFSEKIANLTPEKYSHVSDYEVCNGKLLLIGHPSKRIKSHQRR